jgi:putative ABC transport system permease protein
MLSARWYKVLNDLWGNKTRTLLIVLSIAVGLFAMGTILSSRVVLSAEMARSYAAINPSSGTVRTLGTFDEDFVRSVDAMPGVFAVDARRSLSARLLAASGEWVNITLFAVPDYDQIRVNKIFPQEGDWPPPKREILIERAALPIIEAHIGDVLLIELPDETQRELRIAGTAHDMAQIPAQFDNSPYGYIAFETLEWFGQPYGFNELHIVAERPGDEQYAQQVVNQVKTKAEKSGMVIPMTMTTEPGQIPLDDILRAVLLILGVLGLLSLFLSAFLIVNTISALLAQQKRQIGVMKALGARTRQVLGMYLLMVSLYGLCALLLAIPLSFLGTRTLCQVMAGMFNFDFLDARIPPEIIALQAVVGLLLPALASLAPLSSHLRLRAAQMLSAYQMGRGRFGANWIDRLLSGANLWFARRVLGRPLLLSLRNTFRSKGRLALTLLTLTLASAIFVSVFSLRASIFQTIDDLLQMWNFDIWITFARPYRSERVQVEAVQIAGVLQSDTWLQLTARRVRPDGEESGALFLFAPRAGSDLAPGPAILEGRWLMPGDENALVADAIFMREEPDLCVGDLVVLKINGREYEFRLVGVGMGVMVPMVYANYPYISRISGNYGGADASLVRTQSPEAMAVEAATRALEAHYERVGLRVANVQTILNESAETRVTFQIVIVLLMFMAATLALVGGLGLMGTMSINVLERTREIGILRAVGATNRVVARVFILEGVLIGLLSWAFGSLLAVPLGRLLSDRVGLAIMAAPLTYQFSIQGVWVWLVFVILLSALASFFPARNASRMTVREVLAYE